MCYSIMIEQDLKSLEFEYEAAIDSEAFDDYSKMVLNNPKKFRAIDKNPRIYPGYFAPIMIATPKGRSLLPMRYRVRPSGTKTELPAKYNLYNARLDTITDRNIWKKLFMKNHGMIFYRSFFEWVTGPDGKKMVLNFSPREKKLLCSPVLFDHWEAEEKDEHDFYSFAVITTDPPEEIKMAGHDRCPVHLSSSEIETWIRPKEKSKEEIFSMLNHPFSILFEHSKAS